MSFGNTPRCTACGKTVYPMEELKAEINNKPTPFHKWCFKCTHCARVLSLGNYTTNPNGHVYCKPDFLRLFKEKGNYNSAFAKNLDEQGQGQVAPNAAATPTPTPQEPVASNGGEANPTPSPRAEPRTSREKPKAETKPAAGSLNSKLSVFKQKEEEQRKAQMRALGLKVEEDDEAKAAEEAEREALMKRIQDHKAAQATKDSPSESAPGADESEPAAQPPAPSPSSSSSSEEEEEEKAKVESAPEAHEPEPEAKHEPEPAVQEREPEEAARDVGAVSEAGELASEKIKELIAHYAQSGAAGSAGLKEDLLNLTAGFLKYFD